MVVQVMFFSPLPRLRGLLQRCWGQLEHGLLPSFCRSQSPSWGPALALQAPAFLPQPVNDTSESNEAPSLLDSILWMATPKSRHTIEVNRCRNIDVCPECGNLKQKHVLCGYCYAKVKEETQQIRLEMCKKERGPFSAPTVETTESFMMEKSPQKKMKASGSLKEPGSICLGLFKINAIDLMLTKPVATAGKIMILKNVFLIQC